MSYILIKKGLRRATEEWHASKSIRAVAVKAIPKLNIYVRKKIADLSIRANVRFNGGVARTATKLQNIMGVKLHKGKTNSLYFTNVIPGSYQVVVEHANPRIFSSRKSLICYVGFSNCRADERLSNITGLNLSSTRKLFSYMGGGCENEHKCYRQYLNIKVPAGQRWIKLKFTSRSLTKIEKVTFKPLFSIEDSVSDMQAHINSWIKKEKVCDAKFLLYADISLNVVDGSSVWLSSMASVLCSLGKTVLISKSKIHTDIVLSNVKGRENLIIVTPASLSLAHDFTVSAAISVLKNLDAALEGIKAVIIRGLDASYKINEDRQFKGRAFVYLTDFYKLSQGNLIIDDDSIKKSSVCVKQSAALFVQTSAIEEKLKQITKTSFRSLLTPPVVPDDLPIVKASKCPKAEVIKIGYAGKINPDWGVTELFEATELAKRNGYVVELHIVANKITETGSNGKIPGFAKIIRSRIEELGGHHYQSLNRDDSLRLMSEMDFVWCWRPSRLEANTLELSTKLVEMAAIGARCICYPSKINVERLGSDYPYFLDDIRSFLSVLTERKDVSGDLAERISNEHSLSVVSGRVSELINKYEKQSDLNICFAAHDFKFIDPYYSDLKSKGFSVRRDMWGWGEPTSIERSQESLSWADIVFCEWGLANAVWYSNNMQAGKRLYIRVHLQEVNERARRFGYQINIENVDKVIFVSESVKEKAKELFGWPDEKLIVIPNFVLIDEFSITDKVVGNVLELGMVGIIPQRKRLDRAIDLLIKLNEVGITTRLHIKGPRPEDLDFMHGPSRKAELAYYKDQYERINNIESIRDKVLFSPWGNDVALWYGKIDYILSPSDFESFHYALADGVSSGCLPIVWPWDEAAKIYSADWVVSDVEEALIKILEDRSSCDAVRQRKRQANRDLIISRYGAEKIFYQLQKVLKL